MQKTALITGINGQDASYLAEFLLERDYKVVGMKRRSASSSLWRLKDIIDNTNFELVEGDITDFSSCLSLIQTYKPAEVYNLAAQSHVGTSFSQPLYTMDVTGRAVLNLLESIRLSDSSAKFYQASSSEMFGSNATFYIPDHMRANEFDVKDIEKYKNDINSGLIKIYQNENTRFSPQSPYAVAKLAAHNLVKLYRECYGMYAVGGILFNHESPRRGSNFVTRKITKYFYHLLRQGVPDKLKLGNLDACRDWGYAKEYVEAMWLMLQQDNPKDYVIGTGETHTVKEFLEEVIIYLYNKGNTDNNWLNWIALFIEIDENLKRPAEVPYLKADASLAEKELGWKAKTSFKELVQIMCEQENGKD